MCSVAAPGLALALGAACGRDGALAEASWWQTVGPRLSAAQSDFVPVRDGFASRVPGLDVRVSARGATLFVEQDEISVQLSAWGRAGELLTPAPAGPARGACLETGELLPNGDCVARIEQDHEGLVAWWASRDVGLQQGWDVAARPPGQGPLRFELRIVGADVRVADDGLAWLMGEDGALVRYADLAAWDAAGEPLDAWFQADSGRFGIVVVDDGATYPITVDPIATSETATLTGTASNTAFGYAIAMAGDVNGDGYGDVIVGAPYASSYYGAAYVYHGESAGLSSSASCSITGSASGGYLGYSVAGAGDVNGDGYADVIIGAPSLSSNKGAAYVYHGSSSGTSSTAATTISGSSTSGQLGFAVAGAGDVNGDGYDDVAIGAPTVSTSTGAAYVHHGSSTGISSTASRTLSGSSGYYFGSAVAGAGDVDADGYDDVIIGAFGVSSSTGAAYVYEGGSSGIGASAGASISGAAASDYFGFAVDGAGDVNGDGYDDVIVGAYGVSSNKGAAYVFQGAASGLSTTAATTITGTSSNGQLGIWVAGLGDPDGDGYDDVIVTAYGVSSYTGEAYAYAGSSAGLSSTASVTLTGSSASYFGICADGGSDVDGDGFPDAIVSATGAASSYGAVYLYPGTGAGATTDADADADGYPASIDCDDEDATVYPGATEVDDDGTDQDCDGVDGTAGDPDEDADGFPASTDCDDTDPSVYPGAPERTGDEVDSDCDGREICYSDADGDGFRASSVVVSDDEDCDDSGEASSTLADGDCDDRDAARYPGAPSSDTASNDCATEAESDDDEQDSASDESQMGGNADCTGCGSTGAKATLFALSGLASLRRRRRPKDEPGELKRYRGWAAQIAVICLCSQQGCVWWIPKSGTDAMAVDSDAPEGETDDAATCALPTTQTSILAPPKGGECLGCSLEFAGDVNADGFSDVISGAPQSVDESGTIYLFRGSASGLETAEELLWLESEANLGLVVSGDGDLNGDGYGDVVAAVANAYDSTGAVYFFPGDPSGVDTSSVVVRSGSEVDASFGHAAATAGDIDDDGYDDLALGAPDGGDSGEAFVFLGTADGIASSAEYTLSDSTVSWLGYSLAGAGDLDGDGHPDLAIGAPDTDETRGAVLVYLNDAPVLPEAASTTLTGSALGGLFGYSLASAGDTNGDGYDDLAVGAPQADDWQGRVAAFEGGSAGVDVSSVTLISGPGADAQLGTVLSGLGDMNGDGFDDIVVGAHGVDDYSGAAYLYVGSATGISDAPVTYTSTLGDGLFGTSVAGGGDFDGDGCPDMLIGAGSVIAGGSILVYGSAPSS